MTLLLKHPDAVLDYSVDWGAEYLGEDQLADSQWTVDPEEMGGIAVVASSFEPALATVKAGGGLPGRIYRLTNQVAMQSGRVDSRSITLRVERR